MGRRDLLRVEMKVEVEYKDLQHFYREYTKNLSKGGLFIKTKKVLPQQTVIEITLKIPQFDSPFSLVGEVVHVIEPELAEAHGWDPGMGIQFVDFEEGSKQILDEFGARKYRDNPELRSDDRRQHKRKKLRLRVRFPSEDVLRQDYSQDLSRGGIFIQTAKPRKVGDMIEMTLVHPTTEKELQLNGKVVRIITEDNPRTNMKAGMGIKFIDLREEDKKDIRDFLSLADDQPEEFHEEVDTFEFDD
jgi:uncharacterized protein (TIGR02266 family)